MIIDASHSHPIDNFRRLLKKTKASLLDTCMFQVWSLARRLIKHSLSSTSVQQHFLSIDVLIVKWFRSSKDVEVSTFCMLFWIISIKVTAEILMNFNRKQCYQMKYCQASTKLNATGLFNHFVIYHAWHFRVKAVNQTLLLMPCIW